MGRPKRPVACWCRGIHKSLLSTVVPPDLVHGQPDDLVPAYKHCWVSDGKKLDRNDFISLEALGLIAECETTVDRWTILRTGTAVALGIPIAVFIIGWGLVLAFSPPGA